MTHSLRPFAESLSVELLRSEIGERSALIRKQQAEVAELTAVLVERERRAAVEAGRSERAAEVGATREVQKLTGVTRAEARDLVSVGTAMGPSSETPWRTGAAEAVRDGGISVTKAGVITNGLGEPNDRVSAEDLVLVADHLLEVAPDMTPEQLDRETRARREQLDNLYVVDEERRIQDQRSAKVYVHRDGSGRLIMDLDRESTVVFAEFDTNVTGPKNSGPRFVSAEGEAYEQRVKDDARSREQLLHDALVTVLRAGMGINPDKIPGRQPAVRVLVTAKDLTGRTGYGELEGRGQTVSMQTVERIICDAGIVEVTVDGKGKPLNYGQEKRFFTAAQRTALAIRDGGCRNPDCERCSSETEAHHCILYSQGGLTTLENAIQLCKTDHLDLHNRGAWIEYERDRDMYVMCEPDGTRRDMPSKARIQERVRANAMAELSA